MSRLPHDYSRCIPSTPCPQALGCARALDWPEHARAMSIIDFSKSLRLQAGSLPGVHTLAPADAVKWSEREIARALALQTFERRHLVIVPNCNWTGHECDLLAVTTDLRVIDIEIKISRADLKADARKDKWFHSWNWREDGPWKGDYEARRRREWPQKVWKHYYAVPEDIWDDALLECLPSTRSGVLLLRDSRYGVQAIAKRRATPNKDAQKITAENAIDIARLASLRMWDAYKTIQTLKKTT